MSETALSIVVRKKRSILYKNSVLRITSWNEKGEFDIYPFHANFVAVISKKLEMETNNNTIKEFKIERGILFAKKNVVEVYLEI